MKKIIAMLLVLSMLLALCACGAASGATSEAAQSAAAEASVQAEVPTEEPAPEPETEEAPAGEPEPETEPAEESAAEEVTAEPEAEAEPVPDFVTIRALDATQTETDVEVPYDPQRIAILDLAALDILDGLGLGDRVVGCASTSIDYLAKYSEDENIENLGNIKEADLEAVMACEPDIIFIGGRLSSIYDDLNEIAPVVLLTTDTEIGLLESVRKNATTIASIFGKDEEIAQMLSGYEERIAALKEAANGQTAVIGMATSGSFNLLGNTGRLSLIVNEVGFENVGADLASQNGGHGSGGGNPNYGGGGNPNYGGGEGGSAPAHGEEASFELLVQLDPAYIFVLDRDSAIGTEGAQLAADIMDNELVNETDAAKNGNVIILEHPAVWYTAEGGITAFDIMLDDLEAVLLTIG